MHGWPAAAAIARALVMLERTRASGELEAGAKEGRARISLIEGRVIAIDAPAVSVPRMGHLLVEAGVAREAVERALSGRAKRGPLGGKLGEHAVRSGIASGGAVSHALRLQLRAQVRVIARWSAADLRFERRNVSAPPHAEGARAGELMLGAMREAVEVDGRTIESIRSQLGGGALVLTAVGEALIGGAPLWPEEEALVSVLRGGGTFEELARAGRRSERALRLLAALRVLEAAAPRAASASVSLLARKARQIRRSSSALELLDLPKGARPEEAKAAWRRLAGSLHPDRFASGSPALGAVSTEVVTALNAAAEALRSSAWEREGSPSAQRKRSP